MENKVLDFINNRNLQYKNIDQLSTIVSKEFSVKFPEAKGFVKKLLAEGELIETKKGKIVSLKEKGLLKGKITGHSRGFAFFIPDDVNQPDIFIPNKSLNSAMHNDTVLLKKVKSGKPSKSGEGRVVQIVKRGIKNLVGKVEYTKKNFCFVKPDNLKYHQDIYVKKETMMDAMDNQKVVVEIIKFAPFRKPEGKVVEVLGDSNLAKTDILSIIREYNLIEEFDDKVNNYVSNIPEKVNQDDLKNRLDLRDKNIFTIDGADAKDLDDAVSIEYDKKSKTYELGVHIADVSHYVKNDSVLDKEAFERGTSAYFPHLVLPMLPKELSNGICSLHPNVDRLTMSVFMTMRESDAKIIDYKITESVINSKVRFTYDEVYKILNNDEQLSKKYSKQVKDLNYMSDLALKIEKNRVKRGAIDFDIPESKVEVDDKNLEVNDIYKLQRNESHKLIESFMIAANETVAKHMKENKIPSVYRVHESPNEEEVEDFVALANNLGIKTDLGKDKSDVKPKKLQEFMNEIKDSEYKDLISKILLRTMQKAKYDSRPIGHYGLASTDYCHFTSPIRRYPDLIVHRVLKESLQNSTKLNINDLRKMVNASSEKSSEREVAAEQAERDVIDYFKAQYMEDKVGKEFFAKVSGVTFRGLFVELENAVEGFLKFESLPGDYYEFDEKRFVLANNNNKFTIGDRVKVKLLSASAVDRTIDFEFVEKLDKQI